MRVEAAHTATEAGPALVAALADADWERVASILHPDLQLRGLTPGKYNEAKGPGAVEQAIDIFKLWFYEETDFLTGVLKCKVRPNGRDGQYKLSYSFLAKSPLMSQWHHDVGLGPVSPDVDWVVEQEAYYRVTDGRISWMIILCDGYHRPVYRERTSLQPESRAT
ncbi:MAG: hypothetical protein ACRDZM_17910 [Acidimicrobiia bacterium]